MSRAPSRLSSRSRTDRAAEMITVERLLQKLALQNGATFAVGDAEFQVSEVLGAEGFSFLPLVTLEAVRIARELSAGIESELDMDLIGARCAPGDEPFRINVAVRPVGDDVGVLRGLLFQQAADRVFGWNEQRTIDLRTVVAAYLSDGYEAEHVALETYSVALAARLDAKSHPMAMNE
jgi:hypothetical protein